jgi:hypothetical protein
VFNFLEKRGDITPEERRKIPAASVKRVLGTPEVRAKCGIGWDDGSLLLLASHERVAKALLYVIRDFSEGRKKTADIYNHAQRVAYASGIPQDVVVRPTAKDGEGIPATVARPKQKQVKIAKRAKPRDVLIPRDCILTITEPRIKDIENESRIMSLESLTNAISVLSRVFLELSVDSYISTRGLTIQTNAKLRAKLQDVLNDLVTRKKLSPIQARPLRTALQKNSFLAPSIDLMNDYVHCAAVFPAPSDLRANWNTMQSFFMAIWSV